MLRVLFALFLARVAAQLAVVLFHPRWLPPMNDWYSGLLPYPLLLPVQIAVLVLMIVMIRKPPRSRRLAIGIVVFATLYAGSMLVRLILLRTRHPELLWYEGGMIPIVFHWVLAGFLVMYAARRA